MVMLELEALLEAPSAWEVHTVSSSNTYECFVFDSVAINISFSSIKVLLYFYCYLFYLQCPSVFLKLVVPCLKSAGIHTHYKLAAITTRRHGWMHLAWPSHNLSSKHHNIINKHSSQIPSYRPSLNSHTLM